MDDGERPPKRRKPKRGPVSERTLDNIAAYYLQRFSATRAKLAAVLERRLYKARRDGRAVPEDAEAAIARIVDKYVRAGIVDDAAYAAIKAASQRRQGKSAYHIKNKLKIAGVDEEEIDRALDGAAAETGDEAAASELRAAIRLAEKKRIGPFRAKDRAAKRERDLALLARAGYRLDLARRVIDAADPDRLLDMD